MSTFAQIKSRIADDLNRTDLTTQIAQQILLAIQHYKHERLWFNETNTTLTASISQAYVTAPTDILAIDQFYVTISSVNVPLRQMDLTEIIDFRPSSNGRPSSFCYYQNRFELDRKADVAYSMPLYYLKELAELSAASDTNGWTTDAEDLIVWRAEAILYATVIKDQNLAAASANLTQAALTRLHRLRNSRIATGYTKAHYL